MSLKVGIIGGTSKIGISIAKELASSDFELTALSRNILKAKLVLPNSVSLMEGDLRDKLSLEKFCANVEQVFLNLSVKSNEEENSFHAESEGLKNFLEIAIRKKIKRIYFVSSLLGNFWGKNQADWWVLKTRWEAIQLVKNSGIPFTIFYPSVFMEFFSEIPRIGNKILIGRSPIPKMHFISASDFGKMLKVSIQQNHSENKEYSVQGLDALSFSEATRIFVENLKSEKLSIIKLPMIILKFLGLFYIEWRYYFKFLQTLDSYSEKFQSLESRRELGKPMLSLIEFAKKN